MWFKWLVPVLCLQVVAAQPEEFDEREFDFPEPKLLKLLPPNVASLPPWFLKVKTALNQATDPEKCSSRKVHARYGGHGYFFSWADTSTQVLELNWDEAREFCKARCMEVVSLETLQENAFVKKRMASGSAKYAWTSGRKCNFVGCDRPDLQPHDVYGWFWSGSLQRLPPTTNRLDSDWSDTGGLGKPQPDNREKIQGGENEDCLAILNNLYNDGVKWHDVACHHRKPFICEDSETRVDDVDYGPDIETAEDADKPGILPIEPAKELKPPRRELEEGMKTGMEKLPMKLDERDTAERMQLEENKKVEMELQKLPEVIPIIVR